jgi:SAM-dependent methyltransferase
MPTYPTLPAARLSSDLADSVDTTLLQRKIRDVTARSQYGWGHSIQFGDMRVEGLLRDSYLSIAGGFDHLAWWPARLDGLAIADVGCFTGGIALLAAQRGARLVYAVDEIPEHLDQCRILIEAFDARQIRPILRSAYDLASDIPRRSLDIIVLSGVLYHMSDMLVGLYALRELLKPGGTLLIESNGVDDSTHSYANFGRFYGGMWWQPTGLCIADMCEYMGYEDTQVSFYQQDRCIARATATDRPITFRRGLNVAFDSLRDGAVRSLDPKVMAPAPLIDDR